MNTDGNTPINTSLCYSFDPWGRRRNPTTWMYTNVPTTFLFDRGYTGHEHLDKFGLINMNGRVYDPTLARFLSPDPILQNPGYTQSHNRYSYCLNNPLKYTDPSGYIQKPVGWNDPLPWIPWYGGASGSIGPGSGNHWSDKLDGGEARNYMLMSSNTFNNMYGPGATDIATHLASNASTLNQWRQGLTSISKVRANYGNPAFGPSAGLPGIPGKSVVVNQYGTWVYNMQGVWVLTSEVAAGQGGGILDGIQTGLDVLGLIPGVGEFFDGANALIYTARGDYVNAGLSAAACIPFAGWAATGGKLANKAYTVYQGVDRVTGAVKYVGITSREVAIREAEHWAKGDAWKALRFDAIPGATNLNRIDARIMEQNLINYNRSIGNGLYNQINSIAPKYWPMYGIK